MKKQEIKVAHYQKLAMRAIADERAASMNYPGWCKPILTLAIAALLMGCETTTKTTTNADGSTTTTRTSRQDPKSIKAIETVGAAVGAAAAQAAMQELERQQSR